MRKYQKLREVIVSKYQTMAEFARDMDLSENTLSKKLNGKSLWRANDIQKACSLLNLDQNSISVYFFN